MWERGLKPKLSTTCFIMKVAPHVGAWIETRHPALAITIIAVAPHVGAWIETCRSVPSISLSPVAPHVGAWIETLADFCIEPPLLSLPMWERGLKQQHCQGQGF